MENESSTPREPQVSPQSSSGSPLRKWIIIAIILLLGAVAWFYTTQGKKSAKVKAQETISVIPQKTPAAK